MLFIIYMSDICKVSHLCTVLYADDTSVFVNDIFFDKLLEILNDELNKWSTWLKTNKLSLNVSKLIISFFIELEQHFQMHF